MDMKYIVITVSNKKPNQQIEDKLIPIVFPGCLNHIDVFESISRCIMNHERRNHSPLHTPRIKSAGFVSFHSGKAHCHGKSESLGGVASRGAPDAELITNYENSEEAVKSWEYY